MMLPVGFFVQLMIIFLYSSSRCFYLTVFRLVYINDLWLLVVQTLMDTSNTKVNQIYEATVPPAMTKPKPHSERFAALLRGACFVARLTRT